MSPLAGRRSALRCLTVASGSSTIKTPSGSALPTASSSCCWRPILIHGLTTTLIHHHNQRRLLQTSSTTNSPSKPIPSSQYSPPFSPPAISYSRLLLGRNRRTRYSYLPAIVMGTANQTRKESDDHKPKTTAPGHDHEHSHSHSHGLGHHHHHDTSYLVSRNRSDPGVRITNIGLVSNLAMAIAKFIGGWHFGSKSMVADAWHSMTDLASDVLTLATVSWSIKPPTDRFPLGFGKVESLGSLGVSGLLLVGGCYMGWESAISLYGHFNPEAAHAIAAHVGHGHSHSHGAAALGIPGIHAAWIAAGTVVIKEWLYHATMKIAREKHSSVLASNAIHHRVDSLTGIVTLAAIVGANLITSAGWLDPVGGLLISIMVIHAGIGNMIDAFCELADQSIDEDVKTNVSKQARKAIATMAATHDVELRDVNGVKSGQNYLIDLEMAVPGSWSVEHVREMEEAIRKRVGDKVKGAKRVRVRFVSQQEAVVEKFDEFVTGGETWNPEPEKESESETEEERQETPDEKKHKH